jgi:CubicO group peptidase (beta-lactamase class C family)
MTGAISEHAAPGMTVGVMTLGGTEGLVASAGRYTYDAWSSVNNEDTLYDMASCSKIMGTTTAAAILYQRGLLGLDEKIASAKLLGSAFASQGKGEITVRNLLLHNAGFPPDPVPGYSDPSFPCRQNQNYHPAQEFSCVSTILDHLLYNQTIVTPPGQVFVYSDLSMITLMFVIGKVVNDSGLIASGDMSQPCFDRQNLVCVFHTFVQRFVFER